VFDIASELWTTLKNQGRKIGDNDILIASLVIYNNFILISRDKDFEKVENLKLFKV
jgi:predicted nucleic acid-binding protein